jgi:predicted negative regulator of RcsB-dependent stress response
VKLVKALLVAVLVLGVAGGLVWQFWLKGQVAYAEVATAYGAKMVCSCLHVAERPMESCRQDFTADMSAVSFSDADGTTRAEVLGGLVRAEAKFEPGLGCTLVKP